MDYQKIYNDLIDKARSLNRSKGQGLYLEAHHIIPKCLGGEGHQVEWKTHPNIVLLTGREHFIAHLLLCEIYPTNSKLKHALWAMCNQQTKFQSRDLKITARMYEYIKQLNAQALKGPRPKQPVEANKKRSLKLKGRPSPNKGRKASAETRAKLSQVRKGRVGGGTGSYYSADNIYILGRQQEKEGTEVVGYNFIINVEKSRHVKEKSKIPVSVSFDGGISKWSGLLDLALESGHVIKPSNDFIGDNAEFFMSSDP